MNLPKAVLFDLDGTLIDSEGDIAAACNHALVTVGRAPLANATIASFVGDGARVLIARALRVAHDDALVDRALAAFHPYYESHAAVHTTVMPGAVEVLDAFAALPIGLVTNKPRAVTLAVLEALGLRARFAAIRAGGDGALKPDPRALLDPLAMLRVDARDAWMVGDGEQDVNAGRAAGCVTIGIRGGLQGDARLEASRPDVLLASLRDLVAYFADVSARPLR